MRGWSIRRRWKALRREVQRCASASAARIRPAGAIAVSSRVWWTISMIVRIAELVLETLDPDGVPAVLEPARDEEAGEPARGLREREEPVRHGGRAEPFVAGEPPVSIRRFGPRGRRAQVGAALRFRHRHAERGAVPFRQRKAARVVLARDQLGAPDLLERGLCPKRGNRGIGHRHRAAGARLDLGRHVDHGRMRGMPTPRALPRDRCIARAKARAQQIVPGRMEGDLVEAAPARVEEAELGRVTVGRAPGLAHGGSAPGRAEGGEGLGIPSRRMGHEDRIADHRSTSPGGQGWFVTSWVERSDRASGRGMRCLPPMITPCTQRVTACGALCAQKGIHKANRLCEGACAHPLEMRGEAGR
jgi:hypothetical protein